MRFLIGILTLLIIGSCSSSQELQTKDIVGEYEYSPSYGVYHSMELRQNSTFEYTWVTGLINGITKGSWELQGNRIVFNSDIQPLMNAYNVQQLPSKNSDSINVIIYDDTGNTLPYALCSLKVASSIVLIDTADLQGAVILPNLADADSLIINYLGFKTIRYSLNGSKNDLNFHMIEDNYFRYFTNEKWKIKQNILYDPMPKTGIFNRKRELKRNENALQQ